MKKKNFFTKRPVILLAAAAVLLAGSAVGSTRAALTYYSENYSAQVTVSSIGVSLCENDRIVASRDYDSGSDNWNTSQTPLLQETMKDGVVPGKVYKEALTVRNTGSIDNYVRVILYKSWRNAEGQKDAELSPDLIDLNILTGNGWTIDESASTQVDRYRERVVLYYTQPLAPGAESTPLTDTLKIDNSIASKVKEEISTDDAGNRIIKTTYAYNGYRFDLEAEVDAVQTHSAADAIKSAWGVDVNVADDGTLSLR